MVGLKKKVCIDIAPYGKDVPESVKELVESETTHCFGEWDVFEGPIKDNQGKIRDRKRTKAYWTSRICCP